MDQSFIGRQHILDTIRKRVTDLKEGYRQNLALLGSLHVGKSTLLARVVSDMDDHAIVPVYLDLENRDFYYFAFKLTRSLLYQYARIKGLTVTEDLPALLDAVGAALPLSTAQIREIQAYLEKGKFSDACDLVLALPETFTQETGLSCVIVLDEFQAFEDFGIPDVFSKLAARITTQKRCLYIVASSYEAQAQIILAEKLTLLFGSFEVLTLAPLELKAAQVFIERRMGQVRMGLQLKNFLADFTGGRPLYLDIILQELINLSAIYKQEEIYAPLVVQSIENLIFSRWGALSRHFELITNRLCSGKNNRLVMPILFALANGKHKVKDITEALAVKQAPVAQKLSALITEEVVEKNGGYFHIKDTLMRYWVKYVFEKRVKAIELEPGRQKKEFKEEATRAISDFQVQSRKDLSSRVSELLHCFDNEQLKIHGRFYKMPAFHDVRALKMRQRNGSMMDVIQAETEEGPWLLVLRKDPIAESDINAVADEAKKMGIRPRKCVLVSLSNLDEGARLRALEERMWIWNEMELNSFMSLFDKPYIVP
ncbi:MAG: ATP-binding protein [Candidatus Omnitrophica bacterium]|nr:ATP-binding protein [Candidatus Omnitrophota bacterium]